MRKVIVMIVALAAFMPVLDGCGKEGDSGKEEPSVERVTFSVCDFTVVDDGETGPTRTGFIEHSDGRLEYFWSARDTVGIFPSSGSQVFFVIEGAGGTSNADFDGGGWAFKVSSKYFSYYPFIGDIYLDRSDIPVSYVGQKQRGSEERRVGKESRDRWLPYQ